MSLYSYSAVDPRGKKVSGKITAVNELDLDSRLQGMGLMLLKSKDVSRERSLIKGKVRPRELIVMCIHMEQLERAGVPLMDSIADLRDTTESNALRDLMTEIFEAVKTGSMFSQALAQHPRVFSQVFTGLIEAGEKTGHLADSFKHLADHIKWNEDIKRKLKKAVRYPAILLVVLTGVVSLMMMYVVPQISNFLLSQGFQLPWYSRWLIAVSDAFVNYWYIIFGIPISSVIAIIMLHRYSEKAAYIIDKVMLHVPLIGKNIKKIDLARFSHFFSITFQSGIDILECLDTTHNVVGNRVIKEAINLVKQNVSEGNSITASLRLSNQFPSLVIRMFKVGEDSGDMTQALENINFFYDREVTDSVEATIEYINPILTAVMGGLLFWITAAVFGPLYSNLGKLGV